MLRSTDVTHIQIQLDELVWYLREDGYELPDINAVIRGYCDFIEEALDD